MRTAAVTKPALILILGLHVFVLGAFSQEAPSQEAPETVEARALLREASALVPQIETSNQSAVAIASLQVWAGDIEGALATAQMPSGAPDRLAITWLSSALVERGYVPQAFRLIAERLQGPNTFDAYRLITLQQAEKGDFTSALATAKLILANDPQGRLFVGVLMSIYSMQWKAGDKAGARQTLGEAMAMADKQARSPSNAKSTACSMYLSIANGLDAAGNSAEALPLVALIQRLADQEDDLQEKSLMLWQLVHTQVAAGQYAAAVMKAEALPAGYQRDAILLAVARARINHGDVDGGLAAVEGMSPGTMRLYAMQVAAHKLAASNHYDRALSILDTIPQAKDRAQALATLGQEQAERGDHTAPFTVQLAWETAQEAKPEVDHGVFISIASARASLGDFSSALALIEKLDAMSRALPLQNLTNSMVFAGRKEEALALARSQDSARPKAYGILGIAQALLSQRDAARKSASNK